MDKPAPAPSKINLQSFIAALQPPDGQRYLLWIEPLAEKKGEDSIIPLAAFPTKEEGERALAVLIQTSGYNKAYLTAMGAKSEEALPPATIPSKIPRVNKSLTRKG